MTELVCPKCASGKKPLRQTGLRASGLVCAECGRSPAFWEASVPKILRLVVATVFGIGLAGVAYTILY